MDAVSWAAMALSLVGNVLIARKKHSGFVVWLISNALWILVNVFAIRNVPQIVMYAVYAVTNVYGIAMWGKGAADAK